MIMATIIIGYLSYLFAQESTPHELFTDTG